jgi:hypothetical protein
MREVLRIQPPQMPSSPGRISCVAAPVPEQERGDVLAFPRLSSIAMTLARPGIIREMDVDVVLSPAALDLMLTWLADRKRELIDRNELVKKIEGSKK